MCAATLTAEAAAAAAAAAAEGEKKDAYFAIPTLTDYVTVEQDAPVVACYSRGQSGFERKVYSDLDSIIHFSSLKFDLPLAEIYRDIAFT